MTEIVGELRETLWDHQKTAVSTVSTYLSTGRLEGAALISMPTGTGKTAVIAAAAAEAVRDHGRNVLVLTPWTALVRQLKNDLQGRLWERLEIEAPPDFPQSRSLPSAARVGDLLKLKKPTVVVDTIAAIFAIQRHCHESGVDIRTYFSDFSAVFVDEGHYEPAPKWSAAIRSLKLPTILLTATPYRNDEKYFQIADDHRFRYTHHEAVQNGFLRKPIFSSLTGQTPELFVNDLVDFISSLTSTGSHRVIVRCGDAESIRRCVKELHRLDRSALGVHDTFESRGGLMKWVPDPRTTNVEFWVHQNKLVEGIDDPRFRIVAFYDAFRNDRAAIQQIGRVLRNPRGALAGGPAWVLSRGESDLQTLWSNYLQFDQDSMHGAVATMPDLVENLLASQPKSFYHGGSFKTSLDFDSDLAWKSFAYPLTTRVFRALSQPLSLNELFNDVNQEWAEIDRSVFRRQSPDTSTFILPYVSAENSPFLRRMAFFEPKFGYTLIRIVGRHLFYFDARGRIPSIVEKNFVPVGSKELTRLLPETSTVTEVSLLNTSIGRRSAHARSIRAASIEDLAPDLADYTYLCSRAEGYARNDQETFRRYLGLSRSRVRDYRRTEQTFEEYRQWIETLCAEMQDSSARPADAFSRYAEPIDVPEDPSPLHVLLDIRTENFVRREEAGDVALIVGEAASKVGNDGSFTIEVNGLVHDARLVWDASRERFGFSSNTLASEMFVERGGEERELTRSISADQAFRVVTADSRYIYAHGQFFEPIRPDQELDRFSLLRIMTGVAALESAASEKGSAISDNQWQPNSVFGLIDLLANSGGPAGAQAMNEFFPKIELLICTDLGTEVADFIALQPDRVAFIHAKAGKRNKKSASILQEVVGQAIKNLPHIQPTSQVVPPSGNWTKPWSANGVTGTAERLRVGRGSNVDEIWSQVRSVVTDPQADREVWLVLGAALSVKALQQDAQKTTPSPELLQIYGLLQTAWSAATQMGVRLRIFCSP
ncbi:MULTISPECIES: DEAD/DEAH box helicase [unclassified Arthrobacter]|uniref:DEAD/DEAH box helicase n=1 Tax=unclassified Arthrobacter TaxID=235627 RepID=UPI0027D92C7F|nr:MULTISPECIES: DEAD/DEAH box helicase family protein [unclassified Arthrobacter]